MKMTEQELWFFVDQIAVRESGCGGDKTKADAAMAFMKHLHHPTPDQCRHMFALGYEIRAL